MLTNTLLMILLSDVRMSADAKVSLNDRWGGGDTTFISRATELL